MRFGFTSWPGWGEGDSLAQLGVAVEVRVQFCITSGAHTHTHGHVSLSVVTGRAAFT